MLRYVTYGILLLIIVAAVAGFANAQSYTIPNCNTQYAHYDSALGDCVYNSQYYNNLAYDWYTGHRNTPTNQNPYIKYLSYTSNGQAYSYTNPVYYDSYSGYDWNSPRQSTYYTNAYAVRATTPSSDGATQYGSGYGSYDSSGYSYGPISRASTNYYASGSNYGSGSNTYIRDSYNNYYNGDVYSNSYNQYDSSGYSNGYYNNGYNYGSYGYNGYGSYGGCSNSYYGCGASYTQSAYGYAYGSSPNVYYAFWSSH